MTTPGPGSPGPGVVNSVLRWSAHQRPGRRQQNASQETLTGAPVVLEMRQLLAKSVPV